MLRYMTSHPTAANLLMILMMVAGLFRVSTLKRETLPEVDHYEVTVSVTYKGASPADVELSICQPLEDASDGLLYLEERRCEARSGLGIMTLKMLEKGDFQQFKDDIGSAVDTIDNFPDSSEMPVIEETGRTENVVTVALTADLPKPELKTLAEQVKQRMQQTGNITLVDIQGFSQREFQIRIPHYNLRKYGLSLQDISDRLAHQDIDMPGGTLSGTNREYKIRFNDEARTVDQLENLLVITGSQQGELRLGDIAEVSSNFAEQYPAVSFQGKPAAFLVVSKNKQEDSLRLLENVEHFLEQERMRLPPEVSLVLTQDHTSIISERLQLLINNAWQGLLLVFGVMWLFFGLRYSMWVVMALPVSFLAGFFVLSFTGASINMISMVALLLAIGILMDDSIVISESIAAQIRKGLSPLKAAVNGTNLVTKGILSSFLTTVCVFAGLTFMSGKIGQILGAVPIVLLIVIALSLVEAFFILPHHLYHSLEHQKSRGVNHFRERFEQGFDQWRLKVDRVVTRLIRVRYGFIGAVLALFIVSVSLLATGVIRFSAFPNIEGDVLQARLIMPTGTPLEKTREVVERLHEQLFDISRPLDERQDGKAVQAVSVQFGQNIDAFESGAHLATINVDLLSAERRNFSLEELQTEWLKQAETIPGLWQIAMVEPILGPAGKPIDVRLQGDDLEQLSVASYEMQQWLAGYPGVYNLMDDLRPGMPEMTLRLKEGTISLGIDAATIARQLRAAYQGSKVTETRVGRENIEVVVKLVKDPRSELAIFEQFPIVHPGSGTAIPLHILADVEQTRGYSRIHRINGQRTVTILGDIDKQYNTAGTVNQALIKDFLPEFKSKYPDIGVSFDGEIKEGGKTQSSMRMIMLMAMIGIFILLSFQFQSYIEPLITMLTIPMALIGVIWGHVIMGLDLSMPSMVGFISLSGIVVNDSILLVEFVKRHIAEGLTPHEAAARASHDRLRAVLLTSLTTIAGISPLLFETSMQAQVLIPLATSIVFGIASSTALVLFVVPCLYSILEDYRGRHGIPVVA